jgi:acyl-CoA reductase-like NAD-dependent aldehyde dehydrogenase
VGESLAETIGSRLPDFRVVAQITPWNFPLLMAAWKLGVALAAHPDADKVAFTGSTADAKKIKVGPGMDPTTQLGPLVS